MALLQVPAHTGVVFRRDTSNLNQKKRLHQEATSIVKIKSKQQIEIWQKL